MSAEDKRVQCPCCGYYTLEERGEFEICPVCFWEDDPVQRRDAEFKGGANQVCLKKAQKNYKKYGAAEKRFLQKVRKPSGEEAGNHEK